MLGLQTSGPGICLRISVRQRLSRLKDSGRRLRRLSRKLAPRKRKKLIPKRDKLIENSMTYLVRIFALASMSSMLAMSAFAKTTIESVLFTITKAGTYVLDGDLTLSGTNQTGITVNASNVVIDLTGFILTTSDTTLSN
jgi:hypothetical protein